MYEGTFYRCLLSSCPGNDGKVKIKRGAGFSSELRLILFFLWIDTRILWSLGRLIKGRHSYCITHKYSLQVCVQLFTSAFLKRGKQIHSLSNFPSHMARDEKWTGHAGNSDFNIIKSFIFYLLKENVKTWAIEPYTEKQADTSLKYCTRGIRGIILLWSD